MSDDVPRRSFEETLQWSHEVRENPIRHGSLGDSNVIIYLAIFGGIVFFLIAIWLYSLWASDSEGVTSPVKDGVAETLAGAAAVLSSSGTATTSPVGNPSPPIGPVVRRAPTSAVAVSLPKRTPVAPAAPTTSPSQTAA